MTEAQKDTQRAFEALKAITDGRDPRGPDRSSILVTLEHVVAGVLLATQNQDPRKAAAMLNEGLVMGVENRLSMLTARRAGRV